MATETASSTTHDRLQHLFTLVVEALITYFEDRRAEGETPGAAFFGAALSLLKYTKTRPPRSEQELRESLQSLLIRGLNQPFEKG